MAKFPGKPSSPSGLPHAASLTLAAVLLLYRLPDPEGQAVSPVKSVAVFIGGQVIFPAVHSEFGPADPVGVAADRAP